MWIKDFCQNMAAGLPQKRTRGVKDGSTCIYYDINKSVFYGGQPTPVAVEVSFALRGPDWYKLEQSDEWRRLVEFLKDLQTEQ